MFNYIFDGDIIEVNKTFTLKEGVKMIIINKVSDYEWSLILSALTSELRNGVMNEIFPKRQEDIRKLVQKIEGKKGFDFTLK